MLRVCNRLLLAVVVLGVWLATPGCAQLAGVAKKSLDFTATTGHYTVRFVPSKGSLTITPKGAHTSLALSELSGIAKLNLFKSVKTVRHTGKSWTLAGQSSWTRFTIGVSLPAAIAGEVHVTVRLNPKKDPPSLRLLPDVKLQGAGASALKVWAPAPPVAGTSLFVSNTGLNSSVLYLADLTRLGTYFDRTGTGGAQSNFSYPRASTDGALVGAQGSTFGYVPPPTSLGDLPHGKWTPVIDSYLYLQPGVPQNETSMAQTYLALLGTVYSSLLKPSVPVAAWQSLAAGAATDLAAPANLVTVNGHQYLRSYVSDTRSSPELITQAGVLAGVLAYERKYSVTVPLAAMLEDNLSSFYDSAFHTVKNGLGHDPNAREESWYYVQNLISLLQAAQNGSDTAKQLLLDSAAGAIALAHTNNYEFPQNFAFATWNGKDTGLQSDVAGGYAWLMLGLYDLTSNSTYLDEAKASIAHLAGKGFDLTYETQMTGYAAAAAQRLYSMTHDTAYRGYALLALANLFHVTRLWDCTYGLCRKGSGYHTYFGVNILPWGNYVAMLEQYGAWLGLRDYQTYAQNDPAYLHGLVTGFLDETPNMMQYALPPRLPTGTVPSNPGLYDFVPHNNLGWNIPVEDLRTGEQQSGAIGQELYGAGGTFMFAAYAP